MSWMEQKTLVTGAGGFIGQKLVRKLLEEGQAVRALDLCARPENLEGLAELEWHQGDITLDTSLFPALEGCSRVFHLAAVVGDWGTEATHQAVTVQATRRLFERLATLQAGTRVILASSIVVYGHQLGQRRCHEDLPLGPAQGPYSASKQAQEQLMQQYLARGLDIRTVRPANVYGAGSKPWVEDLAKELRKGTPALIGGGNYPAGLVHVDHVVDILYRASTGNHRGHIFNAADSEGITWRQYMTDIASACGAPEPRSIPRWAARLLASGGENLYRRLRRAERPPLTREAFNLIGAGLDIDMSKTRRMLGFSPFRCYSDGLAEIRASLQSEKPA